MRKINFLDLRVFGSRQQVAMLAVTTMIATVITVSASVSPVSANGQGAHYRAWLSACTGSAAEPAGFSDIRGSTHEAAINCLAHYGITKGSNDGAYNGGGNVTRWHMALFMTRAAPAAGIELESHTDQGFTDTGSLSQEALIAINQAVATGLTEGRTSTKFDPHAAVTRAEMAVWVDNFLTLATPGPLGRAGTKNMSHVEPLRGDGGDFADIQTLDKSIYDAVRRLYLLAVTTGITDTIYSPSAPVTRAQMASFITRALDHTMARPAGLSVQLHQSTFLRDSSSPTLYISMRDENHRPIVEQRFNVMVVETKDINKAFKSDGTCDTDSGFFKNAEACTIADDYLTDTASNFEYYPKGNTAGNFEYRKIVTTDDLTDYTIYVWGDTDNFPVGTAFDRDLHPTETITLSVTEDIDAYEITTSLPNGVRKTKFGDKVDIIIQLLETDDVPEGKISRPVSQADIRFWVEEEWVEEWASKGSERSYPTTDKNGRITLTKMVADPNPGIDDPPVSYTLRVLYVYSQRIFVPIIPILEDGNNITVTWDD